MNYDIDYYKDEIHCLYAEKKELQERIDKAIEYIETGKTFPSDETRETVEYMQNILLDILKGSDIKNGI